jgi:antitoxin (DNA-binding transcriptional repressor) of toxin-antitoxin stability system
MSETVLTIEDAARCLPELVERVHSNGEAALLVKAGQPMARIVPVSNGGGPTEDLIAFLHSWRIAHPEPDEQFADAIQDSRKSIKPARNPWE